MNYEDFKRKLYEELMTRKPDCVEELELTSVQKNNQYMREGVSIHFTGYDNVKPTLYFDDYYDAHLAGQSVEEIAEGLTQTSIEEYERMAGYGFDNLENIDVEKAKENLTLRLINKDWNSEKMEECAYMEVHDLIAVPYLQVERGHQTMSMLVTHELQQRMLQMTDDEVLSIARENLSKQEFEIIGMTQKMRAMLGNDFDETYTEAYVPEKDFLYVMSNKVNTYGAAGMMSQEVMEQIQEKMGEEMFFILPSSVHELLIVPASANSFGPEQLQEMVKEVNETQVAPHERLGENVYFYNGEKLQICHSQKEVMDQIAEKWSNRQKQEQEQTHTHQRRMS